ncbi:thioredoxin fold domain-containing protein [Azovibrio restrictus]|uniref:thioredoxin fold domain-containing protein n=1 Tax=Azovibrio restrictus TaxID=146938 RepID=UPI0026E9A14B|nr:thioredoxin fold domain-containing protein [Azovibrio restrictus]
MAQTLKRRRLLAGGLAGLVLGPILACPPLASAAPPRRDEPLLPARDLQAEAREAARSGFPLVLMFSRQDCPYCITVRRDYLAPLNRIPRFREVLVRQIDQDKETPLTDFQGRPTTHAAFAAREKVRLVPVVGFYGPEGQQLSEAIIGARLPDFYQSYLEAALLQGR